MSAKTVLVLCAYALLAQSILSFCANRASGIGPYGLAGPGIGRAIAGSPLLNNGLTGPGMAYGSLTGLPGRGLPCDSILSPAVEFTTTSGGGLLVTSTSAIAPTGITVVSENVFEGPLSVAGELPFVGTTGVEGDMPSAGVGAINHGCGDGDTAMVSEATFAPAATASAATVLPSAGFGSSAGLGLGLSPAAFGSNRLGVGGCRRGVLY